MGAESIYYINLMVKSYQYYYLFYLYIFTFFVFGVYFVRVTLFGFRKMNNLKRLSEIGVLEEICMYDFYSGEPRPKNAASTRESLNPSFVNDRKYLIFTPRSAIQFQNQIVLDRFSFFSLRPDLVFGKDNINLWMKSTREAVYFPDGSYIYVYDCGDSVAQYFKCAYGAGLLNYRLGVQTNYDKTLSRDFYRHSRKNSNIRTSLDPRHAVCTLVNKKSINDISKKRISTEPAEELSHYNFRPHLVISATEYEEDKIKYIKIGTAEFGDPLPCLIDQKVNYNSVSRYLSTVNEPYLALIRNRKLKDVCPTISRFSDVPVFGLNLIVLKHGEFKATDKVYAAFY